jgi:hypothetical protein
MFTGVAQHAGQPPQRGRAEVPGTSGQGDAVSHQSVSALQAVKLVRALRDQLDEMTREAAWLRRDIRGRGRQSLALRRAAAALRQDIKEAQTLIDRLERRYLNGDGQAPTSSQRRRGAR